MDRDKGAVVKQRCSKRVRDALDRWSMLDMEDIWMEKKKKPERRGYFPMFPLVNLAEKLSLRRDIEFYTNMWLREKGNY